MIATAARWAMVAVNAVYILSAGLLTSFGGNGYPPSGPAVVAIPLALAVLGLQLRHSFAAARGERPRGAYLTLLAMVVLVYLPLRWFWYGQWLGLQAALVASASMLLPRWAAVAAIAAIIVGTDVADVRSLAGQPVGMVLYWLGFDTAGWLQAWIALYGSARLVRFLDELREARTELAELAIGRERLRVSRDLHDLLGQSLSAVSLKSDLAVRLLRSDAPAASREIEDLTAVAREALRGVQALTRDEHAVSLRAEVEGAAALLASAGIAAEVELDVGGLGPDQERLLAWTVREGVTNVLRHSQARHCTIAAGRRDGRVRLEIVNDGASDPIGRGGTGLTGLAERARALSGSAFAANAAPGSFRLIVEVPAPA